MEDWTVNELISLVVRYGDNRSDSARAAIANRNGLAGEYEAQARATLDEIRRIINAERKS